MTYYIDEQLVDSAGCCGLNVCAERDIYRWARGEAAQTVTIPRRESI